MLRWLDSGNVNRPEGLISAKNIKHQIIGILKDPVNLEKVRAIAASRTAGIWRIKRAKIILLTMEGRNIARVVLDVRVPPESILKYQVGFAHLGLKYFDHPSKEPTQREAAVERMLSFLENPPPVRSVLWKRTSLRYIGHDFSAEGIREIRDMIRTNPHWSKNQITREVCELFDLRQSDGKFKHSQIGQALIRMAMDNLITLPASLRAKEISPKAAKKSAVKNAALKIRKRPLTNPADIETIQFIPVLNSNDLSLWRTLIEKFHYIDTSKLFGAQMRYLVYGGKNIEPTLVP